MAKHEFEIMESAPVSGKRYDGYEPKKYNCISVDDDYIEAIEQLLIFDSFCHTIDIPMNGLNYIGITLIPPKSLDEFLTVICDSAEYAELRNLLIEAKGRNKYVIHYGL